MFNRKYKWLSGWMLKKLFNLIKKVFAVSIHEKSPKKRLQQSVEMRGVV